MDRLWGTAVGIFLGCVAGAFISVAQLKMLPRDPIAQAETDAYMMRGALLGGLIGGTVLFGADVLRTRRARPEAAGPKTFIARCLKCQVEMNVNFARLGKLTTCIHCGSEMPITSRPPA